MTIRNVCTIDPKGKADRFFLLLKPSIVVHLATSTTWIAEDKTMSMKNVARLLHTCATNNCLLLFDYVSSVAISLPHTC